MDLPTLAARAADTLDGLPAGSRVGSPVPRLSVFRSTAPTALTPDLYEPVVCLILQGHKETTFGGTTLPVGPMPEDDVECRVMGPLLLRETHFRLLMAPHSGMLRRLLRPEHSVTNVAYDVGYASPNQFSREYARRFGVPPREHLPSTATG